MDLSATQRGQYRVAFTRPASLPGVTIGQFRSDGHLFTCVTDRYASALHLSLRRASRPLLRAGEEPWRTQRWRGREAMTDLVRREAELLLYQTEDGRTRIIDGTPRAGDAA